MEAYIMKRKITGAIFSLAILGCVPLEANALPVLQLDIAGGTYDSATETIVTSSDTLTLYALLKPNLSNTLSDTYYISAALTPQINTSASLGSFVFNGTTVNATSDMVYGVPPLEAILLRDRGDLPGHSIFPTYFKEFGFQFDSANSIAKYNSQDRAISGEAIDTTYNSTGGMYFARFDVDVSSLGAGYELHFDLYNTNLASTALTTGDIDVTKFAPFSHDAETTSVPEPGTLLLMGSGLTGLYFSRKLRRK
jgi:hypothetical protein